MWGAPIEALACGTPVISSANGAMPETIRHSTGIVCRTYEEMVSAYSRLEQIRPEDCRSKAEKMFSSLQMANSYLALYEKIIRLGELDQSPRYDFRPDTIEYVFKSSLRNYLETTFRSQRERYKAKFWTKAALGFWCVDFANSMVDL